jgi:hypothetical protein
MNIKKEVSLPHPVDTPLSLKKGVHVPSTGKEDS